MLSIFFNDLSQHWVCFGKFSQRLGRRVLRNAHISSSPSRCFYLAKIDKIFSIIYTSIKCTIKGNKFIIKFGDKMTNLTLPELTSITQIRQQTKSVFANVRRQNRPVVVVQNSQMVGVILSPITYEKLIQSYQAHEDIKDSLDLKEAITTSDNQFINLEDYFKKNVSGKNRKKGN